MEVLKQAELSAATQALRDWLESDDSLDWDAVERARDEAWGDDPWPQGRRVDNGYRFGCLCGWKGIARRDRVQAEREFFDHATGKMAANG